MTELCPRCLNEKEDIDTELCEGCTSAENEEEELGVKHYDE